MSSTGVTRSMSSRQCLGGSGISSFAAVMRTSVPQMLHRYMLFTLRSSPAGGGSGTGSASPPTIAKPILNMTQTASAGPNRANSAAHAANNDKPTLNGSSHADTDEHTDRPTPPDSAQHKPAQA